MGKNNVVVRTASDLERKYNFASLLGLKKNVEKTAQGMQKVENELNNMLNALTINLKGVFGDISKLDYVNLLFYNGLPEENFIPGTKKGDLYYNRDTGYVYQRTQDFDMVWELKADPNLIEAMAITNAEIDTQDNRRTVFFKTPSPAYSNGDWWIKEDGSLYICQISKEEGTFEENDFINSSKYTESIAQKVGEEIKVLKGTVTAISENYAKFTDLATGGSTTIAGENITTGNIKSENYIKNVSGMKIVLLTGVIDSKNFKTDEEGNVYLGTGAKVIGGDGLMTNLSFSSATGNMPLGWFYEAEYHKMAINIPYSIPKNFKIEQAYITLFHTPCYSSIYGATGYQHYWCYSRAVKAYKLKNENLYFETNGVVGTPYYGDIEEVDEITGAFGSDGFTAQVASATSHSSEHISSIDITSHFQSGENGILILKTSESTPASEAESIVRTGNGFATLHIIGYMSYEKEAE